MIRSIRLAISASAATCVLAVTAANVGAQETWNYEARVGAALPQGDLAGADLQTGFGFEGTLAYSPAPRTWMYAGWGWYRFRADESFAGVDVHVEESGYVFGLRYEHPLTSARGGPALRVSGGGTVEEIEIQNDEGDIRLDSDHGLGWEVGAGFVLPIGVGWRMIPAARFRFLPRTFTFAGFETGVELKHLVLEIGFAGRF